MRTRVAVALRATITQCFVSVSLKALEYVGGHAGPWIATERLSGARFGNTGLKDWSMQDDFFLGSIYRRFDAAIDRIDSRERSPTPRKADIKDAPP
jgi:hypothetical protein